MTVRVVFFDIGTTLGQLAISPDGRPLRLDLYSYVRRILATPRDKGLRLGGISNTGARPRSEIDALLREAGIVEYFDQALLLYSSVLGLEKSSPEIFLRAAQIAQEPAAYCMFVGEASAERMHAAAAGMQVCPHPLLIDDALRGDTFRFVRIVVPAESAGSDWRGALRDYPVLPMQVSGAPEKVVHAIASRRARALIANAQFSFQPLGREGDPLVTDVYLLRDDRAARTGFLSNEGQSEPIVAGDLDAEIVLSGSPEGLVVALPAGRSVEELHMEEAQHGHNSKLVPDPGLLENFDTPPPAAAWLARPVVDTALDPAELAILNEITKARIERSLAKYVGTEPLSDGARLGSRHIQSDDNARAVAELARDLSASGRLAVTLHPFPHEGRELFNVVAHLQGDDAGVVLVTAHLDSTAKSSPPYDPVRDPAPGADDDGSGVAAVLTAAETLLKLASARRPRQSIRFVLFNAEEHGLAGSKAYAKDQADMGARIAAVFQMDMVGFNRAPPRSWEVHAGFWPSADVQFRSRELALLLEKLRPVVSPELTVPQIYLSVRPQPSERDPAEGRSDHTPFHEHGYAACVTSEDLFAGPQPDSPAPEGNPDYHKKTDTFVDAEYAADIARVVAAAAWVTARS
jgi:leucyl aminopeptidase